MSRVLFQEPRTFFRCGEIARRLTAEYIRGLFEGEGTFTNDRTARGVPVPCVTLKMHWRNRELVEGIRDYLGIKNRVYEYRRDGRHWVVLIIRDMPTLKNIIVPLFKNQLLGHKGVQFEEWLKMFPSVSSLHHRNLPGKQTG